MWGEDYKYACMHAVVPVIQIIASYSTLYEKSSHISKLVLELGPSPFLMHVA